MLGFLLCILLTPVLGALIVAFLPDDREAEERRDRKFRCGICHIKYRDELLGGETVAEGKICRFCLEKKQKGEK